MIGKYKNDKKEGEWKYRRDGVSELNNDNLWKREQYKNGLLDGLYKEKHPTGQMWKNYRYKDAKFLVKLSTAVTHLIGIPNHDSMTGKYYARFFVKHEDNSDSYLRKAYINMDLHTDGTYVNEITDWILMTKIEEKNVKGDQTTGAFKRHS